MDLAGQIATWFLIFVSYSMIGWVMEVGYNVVAKRKMTNRGFFIGPVCPIYGAGALLMTILISDTGNIFEVFAVAVLGSAVLEYLTSVVMEKLFHVRWWDYSEKPFNLNGRICLENLFYFGILGLIVIKFINPLLFGFFNSWDVVIRIVIACVIFLIWLLDFGVSLWLIIGCRVTVGTIAPDATDEITERVREILIDKGRVKGKLNRRLVKAFPDMSAKQQPKKPRRSTKNKV